MYLFDSDISKSTATLRWLSNLFTTSYQLLVVVEVVDLLIFFTSLFVLN